MKWGDIFQEPDMVGQTEYLAIHDTIAGSVLGTDDPDPESVLTAGQQEQIAGSLAEIEQQAHLLQETLSKYMLRMPVSAVDWALLRKQKAEIVQVMMNKETKRQLQEALEGIVGFLDDVQDRAERVMGSKQVFGR